MSQDRAAPRGVLLRPYFLRVLLGVAFGATLGGCYQGEWRLGIETPVSTATRLVPTRDIERWELNPSTVANVLQVKATVSPRCRYALYGTMRRTDTGRFKRIGGGWWTALAIATGAAGGAAGGFGLGGWVSNLYPEWGRYAMFGAGGAVVAGGLASCVAALVSPSKLRFAMCGILVGFGGAVLGGAGISGLAGAGSTSSSPTNPGFTPLIDVNTFRTLAFTGAGLVGGSIFSGIISGSWRGYIDRERSVDIESAQSWDAQTSEQPCATNRPMAGRTAALEVTSEYLTEGLGSDASPIKIRIALGGQSSQTVDLRPLRQALSSCGALHVQLAPDIMYEMYVDDYMPPVPPDQIVPGSRPVHGIITPRDGVWLPAPRGILRERWAAPKKPIGVPGVSPEVLASVERRCRGEQSDDMEVAAGPPASDTESRNADGPRVSRPRPSVAPMAPAAGAEAPQAPPSTASRNAPAGASENTFMATPGLTPQRRPLARGDSDDGECSADAQQARYADCEHQCGRALELSTCLFTFRKCHINARGSAQPQKEHDACDLAWEQCLYNANIAPGSWRRCVDGCVQTNEPASCKLRN